MTEAARNEILATAHRVLELAEKATDPPWMTDDAHGPYIVAQTTRDGHRGTVVSFGQRNPDAGHYWPALGMGGISFEETQANADYIADSRESCPQLAAAVVEMANRLEAYEAVLEIVSLGPDSKDSAFDTSVALAGLAERALKTTPPESLVPKEDSQ